MGSLSAVVTTFLFTDIEGSTRLWEREPQRMSLALARHDALARSAVEANRGLLVKTTGDGIHAAFDDPLDAVAASLELQRRLSDPNATHGLALLVRCGLHLGVAERRDDEFFGTPVNRAARIMTAAHGGQVLLSQAVAAEITDRLRDGVTLRDLGAVRLRDLASPEHVFQLVHPQLRSEFPALRSLEATPNNLPQQLTSFIGREREIAEVKTLLRRTRLLTLTGSGGCGKTRLMLQLAADVLDSYPDGVWLVELAPLADPSMVSQTVAAVLGLREEPGKSLTQTLIDHLESRQAMLVLDNAEHLLWACAEVVDALLRQCSQVVVLVSSREALGIGGEISYRVRSLSMPDAKRDSTPDRLSHCESARLFIERAQSQLPLFGVTEQNAAALASICSRLDGIPLAIELAAARVGSLSVEELNERLDQRFRLLTGGSRTALPRQQTLRSAIDWSYDLLNDTERALFARLAVFAGGWTLEATEQLCSDNNIGAEAVLDVLTSLANKSLVVADTHGGATRYRLLETMRQYARDRLLESGEGNYWRDRHLAYFIAFAEGAAPHLAGADEQTWLNRLETEHDNLRVALVWSAAPGGNASGGLRMAAALWRFWYVRGYLDEGRRSLAGLLAAAPAEHDAARATALNGAGVLAWQQAEYSAANAFFQESLAIRRELGDRQGISDSLGNLGMIAYDHCDYPVARTLLTECLAIKRELGEQRGIAGTMINLGSVASEQGDYLAARALFEEGLAIFRQLGNQRGVAALLIDLGNIAVDSGDFPTAGDLFDDGLAIQRQLGDQSGVAASLHSLGNLAREQRDYRSARVLYEESLEIRRELGERRGIASSLAGLANVAFDQGETASALALHQESLAIRHELGDRLGIAASLEGLASVASATEAPDIAARIWGAAESLRRQVGTPLPPVEQPRFNQMVAAARSAMGDDQAFESAWQKGRTMTAEQAIGYALNKHDANP